MIKLRYISFLIVFVCTIAKAQVVPWTVTTNSTNFQEVVLKNVATTVNYDFQFNTNGDAIGIFYDKAGIFTCAGYIQLDGVTDSFLIYGDTGGDSGFQSLEMFHVMYWRKEQNCIIDMPASGWSNAQYSNGGSDTIHVLGAWPVVVEYPKSYICKYDTPPIPLTVTGATWNDIKTNTVFPPGLNVGLSPFDGSLEDLSLMIPGTYTIPIIIDATYGNQCLRNTSITLTLSTKLVSSPVIAVKHTDCIDTLGKIEVDTSTIINGTKPYIIGLKSITTGNTIFSSSGSFTELMADNYQLIIQDQKTCADTIPVSILAPDMDCDHVSDILTPLQNNKYSEVFLPWAGLTKIYNSQAQLIHSFTTPAIWDGKDQYGRHVPTGAYFIFTEGKKKKEITVVY